jgi:hypothetical protein
MNPKSPRKKMINKVKAKMRELLKLRDGEKCFFCGKSQKSLRFSLSIFHILSVATFPKLECELENTVLACWAPYHFSGNCHNRWEKREPERKQMEEKLLLVKGKDYLTALKIQDKILPKLNIQRAEMLLKYYEKEVKKLKEKKNE